MNNNINLEFTNQPETILGKTNCSNYIDSIYPQPEEIQNTKKEKRKEIKDISPWIFTTQNCNLRCTYCYEKHGNENITHKTLYDINSYFKKYIDEGDLDFVNYRISGGEPMMNFITWKQPVLDAIKENKGKLSVTILTNLTLLNNDIEKFIIDNNIGCSISLDGLEYSKPYENGKSSASFVKKNIERFIKNGFKNINITTVIDKDTIDGLNDLADFIGKNKILWNIELNHFFMGTMEAGIIISKMKEAIQVLNTHHYDFYKLFKFNNISLDNPQWGCSAGKYLIAIDIKGNIYPCQTVTNKQALTSIYSKEHLIDVLMEQKTYEVGFNFKYDSDCNDCSLIKLCGSGCKLHNRKENKKYTCPIIREVIYDVLTKII
jgi:uncharacterized protein